ncbi:4-diphosphocytidyl-2-C-methyl-D-erythritol kinase [Psychromonas ingrahamii 37]|uniref:4-diphosphocytidyl-2-C-methyl-D-erythritol kinase n=1 Tax=Psychromonas ingrahamii (strain DSM 17664 / CCUG 51855 / 37) TaxID=357804 RepID=ISPE_PSYIN|nr:4-(cytidine 5'-diphospho)-2-C-methyl-D-erythritol kinase [Psychromonas ingrahamii]A1STD9.1 RecName: Full=4-diphosphocytidyl-2-C-methyl-D-erythritol kinase; Short=CMK; AltName: Full=4-(cytidine-5'-diphospho)-2-C-methyl-D-erythritol kinase [Psychromonas ingrahamii 37]ABM02754.1 4-diphosphocytidyl-2-C-methyl-D-erythritol kinase [Psychromonas ingrahamii 37]
MIHNETIRWPAPAKLNLFLYITGQREDGYHELQTLFQFIDLCDYLTITPNLSGKITLTPNIEGLALENNLIYKAAMILKTHTAANNGAHITLEKNLPMGGGLGGGSSDAATTLVALNHQWNINLTKDKLAEIGVLLGADVPVFIFGKAAIAEGIGEKLTPAYPAERSYLIAVPDCHISTAAVFQAKNLIRNTKKRTHLQLINQNWLNDCQPYVKKNYPKVAKVIEWLIEYAPTQLTGTGACVFSTFNSINEAEIVLHNTPDWLAALTAKGLNNSPLNELLATLK